MVTKNSSEFDAFAENYDIALNQGISLSGENKDYFAQARIDWLQQRLRDFSFEPHRILDYGCGTGTSTPLLMKLAPGGEVMGCDISDASIQVASRTHGESCRFFTSTEENFPNDLDLVFCNGVFHHIPLQERAAAVTQIMQSLRPGGIFAFWENNPWNPGTRIVMSRIPFDRDAITLSPIQGQRLLKSAGFRILVLDSLFYFPRFLKFLRPFEKTLSILPLGAQYLVLATKSPSSAGIQR